MFILDIEEIKKTEVQSNKMEIKREDLRTMPSLTIIQVLVSLYLIQKLIVGKVRHHQNVEKQHVYRLLYLFTHSGVKQAWWGLSCTYFKFSVLCVWFVLSFVLYSQYFQYLCSVHSDFL